MHRTGSVYIPYSGLICNDYGHMGEYPVVIYKLYKSDFYKIAEGVMREANNNDPITFVYEWEGTSCSQEEFEASKEVIY